MVKSFLKWAGGKSSLIQKIISYFPRGNPKENDLFGEKAEATRFIEPFCGSSVIYLNTNYQYSIINDINTDLINTYKNIIKYEHIFIEKLEKLFRNNTSNDYYNLREEFNTTTDNFRKSLLFIYINRHCFNGLCRYNNKGKFNVPCGHYSSVMVPIKEINAFIERSKNGKLKITNDSFEKVFEIVKGKEDVIYVDPPYMPINNTSSFTKYYSKDFNYEDQKLLAKLCEESANIGATVVVSNNDVPIVRELYKNAEIITIRVNKSIGATTRNKVNEILAIFR